MEENRFVALLIITMLAVAVPVLLSRVKVIVLPVVVGEVLAGMVIGKSGLDLVPSSEVLHFLAEFGFAFLMFLSGLEINFSLITGSGTVADVRRWWVRPVPLSLLLVTLTISLAIAAAFGLQAAGLVDNPLLMGLILSTTSLGIVGPVLKERRLLGSEYGQYLLIAASLADFVTLLLLTVVIATYSRGLTLDLLLIPVLLLLFLLAIRVGRRFAQHPILVRIFEELAHATSQVQVRGALAVLIAWVVLAEVFGVELILGAFLAGAIVNLTSGPNQTELREKLDAIGFGFFIPIFFIMVGAEFDLAAITGAPNALALVPLLIVIAYVVKLVPTLLFRFRFSWRDALAAGTLLSARLSLIIAAAAIALDIGAISEAVSNAVILIAIVTCTISPLAFNRLYKTPVEKGRAGLIIVGSDQTVSLLIQRLQHHIQSVTVISRDPSRVAALRDEGIRVVEGAASDPAVLEQANGSDAQALVVLSSDKELMLNACKLARQKFQIPVIVAGVSDADLIGELRGLDVRVVQPVLATVMAYEGALRFPSIFDMLIDKEDDVEVVDVTVTNAVVMGKSLRRIRLPSNALVLSLVRDGTTLVPHGNTVLQRGDTLSLIGSEEALQAASDFLSASSR